MLVRLRSSKGGSMPFMIKLDESTRKEESFATAGEDF